MKFLTAIPVYNEERHVEEVLQEVRRYSPNILVVNDGSSDHTADKVKAFPRATLINHNRNRGSGASTNTGVKHARGEICVMTDGDGTYPVQDIPRLLAEMDETVSQFPTQMLGHLGTADLRTLVDLLERARLHCDDRANPTCDGTSKS